MLKPLLIKLKNRIKVILINSKILPDLHDKFAKYKQIYNVLFKVILIDSKILSDLQEIYHKYKQIYDKFYVKFDYYRDELDYTLTDFFEHYGRYWRRNKKWVILFMLIYPGYLLLYKSYEKFYFFLCHKAPAKYDSLRDWVAHFEYVDHYFYQIVIRLPFRFNYRLYDINIFTPKDINFNYKSTLKLLVDDTEIYNYQCKIKTNIVWDYTINAWEKWNFQFTAIDIDNIIHSYRLPFLIDQAEVFPLLLYSAINKDPAMLSEILNQRFIKSSYFDSFY